LWKVWKHKFGGVVKRPACIGGKSDEVSIANLLANSFGAACSPPHPHRKESNRPALQERLNNYVGASCNYDSIVSLNVLDKLITNLPTKKSPGFDLLSAEHLKYSHPIILKIIRLLISLMVSNRYVPSAFSCGITVPLPKATYKRSQTSVNDYRGITIILPIISKLLKFTQLKCLITFLGTSAAQFGFKKGHSCTHAIFSARKLLIILPHKTPLLIFAHWTSVRLLTVSAILICLTNFWTEIYLLIFSVF